MREVIIAPRDAAQRLDRFLEKYLRSAGKGFIYKMLRRKNITLNGKKAQGNEKLAAGDCVRLWMSEETLGKFTGPEDELLFPVTKLDILYEDTDVLLVSKPSGMLSQKARPEDTSLCEYLIGYMQQTGQITQEELRVFRPSVCNRLDRNTSGIVCCGKTMAGLQYLSRILQERSVHKYYAALVLGKMDGPRRVSGYLKKDPGSNRVTVYDRETPGADSIITEYRPVRTGVIDGTGLSVTLLEVLLVTGKAHQIRAHLASLGHPVAGDPKYGRPSDNRKLADAFGIRSQLLHSARMEFPVNTDALPQLSGRVITAPLPQYFAKVMQAVR